MITLIDGKINADHLPFYLRENNTLCAHIAKGNPLWKSLKESENILVIFQGAHHYISPNWYPSKEIHHKEVPTWNYIVVHVYGDLKIKEDPEWIRGHLDELTEQNEREQQKPWKVSDAPEKYINQQLKGIVGLEIKINQMIGKCKAGQNKKQPEQGGMINALDKIGTPNAAGISEIIKAFKD